MEVCNNQQAMVCLCGKKYKCKEYYNKHVLGCNGLVIDSHENDDEGDPLATMVDIHGGVMDSTKSDGGDPLTIIENSNGGMYSSESDMVIH